VNVEGHPVAHAAFSCVDAGNCTARHYKPAFKRSHVQLILTVQGERAGPVIVRLRERGHR